MSVAKYEEEYKMDHERRDKAVTFNQETFRRLRKRPRSAVDVSVLQETYKELGFEVLVHQNLNFPDIQIAITKRKFKQGVLN